MDAKIETVNAVPPRLIGSVVAGFNTVTSHIYLILFPVVLDVFLWFGPHVRVKTLLEPVINNFLAWLTENNNTPDMQALFKSFQDAFQGILTQTNLLIGLRTWPVGIPSLFYGSSSIRTPMGDAQIIEMPNTISAVFTWIGIIAVGTLAGTFFFNSVSKASFDQRIPFSIKLNLWQYGQCILLLVLLLVLAVVILIPFSMIVSIFSLLNPSLGQFAAWGILFLLIWILLPLIFSAHGIFMFNFNTVISIATSVRLVRFFLPGTGVFLVTTFLLNEGMDVLWRMSPADSWMTLVGITGHAFIVSALLAGSFIYYGSGMRWMHDNLQQRMAAPAARA
jgi:hypothetical protein